MAVVGQRAQQWHRGRQRKKTREDIITQCAILYNEEREKAKKAGSTVPNGTLQKLLHEKVLEARLSSNSISLDTIRSRVKRGNLAVFNETELSTIAEIETLICDMCLRLAKMGLPLTKSTVLELANDLINKTEISRKTCGCQKA
jgi:hypothetical protein